MGKLQQPGIANCIEMHFKFHINLGLNVLYEYYRKFVWKSNARQNQCNKDSHTLRMTKSPYVCCCSHNPCWQRNIQGRALMIVGGFPRFTAVCFSNITKTNVHIVLRCFTRTVLCQLHVELHPLGDHALSRKHFKELVTSVKTKVGVPAQTKYLNHVMSGVKRDLLNVFMCVHYFDGPFNHRVSSLQLQSAPASNKQVC